MADGVEDSRVSTSPVYRPDTPEWMEVGGTGSTPPAPALVDDRPRPSNLFELLTSQVSVHIGDIHS